jgi:hypothetical protein
MKRDWLAIIVIAVEIAVVVGAAIALYAALNAY